MIDVLPLLALGGAVFLGTTTQRVTGMGFALVASPFLVALLGPIQGIVIVNIFGVLTALSVLLSVWPRVERRKAITLLIPAVLATVPGALVARSIPPALLSVLIGATVLVALGGSFFVRNIRFFARRIGAVTAGAISGFMNVTAGVGGPAISAYAIATRWPQEAFAATAQLYFCVLGAASLAAKWTLPQLEAGQWTACGVAVVLGVLCGRLLSRWIGARAARGMMILFAFAGALLILVKGMLELAGGT